VRRLRGLVGRALQVYLTPPQSGFCRRSRFTMSERTEHSLELTTSGMRRRGFAPVVAQPYVGPATRWGHSQPAAPGLRHLVQVRPLLRTIDLAVAA
jgi:hypothetical protein